LRYAGPVLLSALSVASGGSITARGMCQNTIVQAFVSSRLHYCNALFYGITQSVQASAVDPECGGAPSFAPLTPTFSLFRGQTLDLATGVSRLLVREFVTVYPPHCGSLTLNLDTLNDF